MTDHQDAPLPAEVVQAQGFELTMKEKDARQSRLGWMAAGLMFLLLCAAMGAIIIMLPLKTTLVQLYSIEMQTGRIQQVTTADIQNLEKEEVVNRAVTAQYVKMREGYNYFSLQNDYNAVQLMSTPDVRNAYLALFNSDKSPELVYEQAATVVKTEVVTNEFSQGTGRQLISDIRLKRIYTDLKNNGAVSREDYLKIRLTFYYNPQKEMTAQEREINPFGFTVSSYSSVVEQDGKGKK